MKKGYVHIYTGDGKGKTTCAVGLAMRAAAAGLRVAFFQFFKGESLCNELRGLKRGCKRVKIVCSAQKHPSFKVEILNNAKKAINSGKFDLVIMDEILIALRDKFVKEKEILDLIYSNPKEVELVLTGRGATSRIIKAADYVTEFKKIKHPYDKKVKARQGIEY